MASRLAPVLLLVLCAIASSATASIVGGRTEIKNVKSNKMVQSLGKFAVEEYDKGVKGGSNAAALVSFSSVISAESQVVAGTKYYLKIAAEDSHHARKLFDAEVVIKPWLKSKQLLSFKPAH
ncbi:cysteine proteinase inhibitor B-like [Dioscorea cayenensis subsp. rotundata]|uniref:Cysteine proteinase inhibitor B-like n=1 Tax=Dioscorea cayennensis subsp. rotundata TaxID=55577 RepID=A0AB40C3D9_DIOCR|nr:cysteine proteinase inhibitor B-like [Dioscorea cayenensis subsp. rotundata]